MCIVCLYMAFRLRIEVQCKKAFKAMDRGVVCLHITFKVKNFQMYNGVNVRNRDLDFFFMCDF